MRCPYCGNLDTKVIDSRYVEELFSVRRRRECSHCQKRFTTYEKIESSPIVVKKKDGRREPFDDNKLRKGLELACRKRPIAAETINNIVTSIEQQLKARESTEVESSEVGEMALLALYQLDKVAYIRFASVYREFDDIESFKKELDKLIIEETEV